METSNNSNSKLWLITLETPHCAECVKQGMFTTREYESGSASVQIREFPKCSAGKGKWSGSLLSMVQVSRPSFWQFWKKFKMLVLRRLLRSMSFSPESIPELKRIGNAL